MVFDGSSKTPVLVVALSLLTPGDPLCISCTPVDSGKSLDRKTDISRVLERAVEYGAKIEHPLFRADLFRDLVPSYVEIGDTKSAISIANREDNERDMTLVAISRKQVELGQIDEALNTAAMVAATGWKASFLRDIAQEMVKQGKRGEALKLLSEAKELALSEEDIGYLYFKGEVLLSVAEAQWVAQDGEGARLTMQQAIEIFEGQSDQSALSKKLFLIDVAELQVRMGDKEGMLATIQRIPIGHDRDMAFRLAAGAQAESGDTRGALDTVAKIQNRWAKDMALYPIARIQAKADDIHGASKTAGAISHGTMYKSFALLHIAQAQEARSDREAALRTLAKAESNARTIPDTNERANAFGVIARIQGKMGDTRGAAANIERALPLVDRGEDTDAPDMALTEIVEAQIEAADIKGAMKSAEAMDPDFRKFSVNRQIAEAQALAGDFQGAVQTSQKSHPGEEGLWRASTLKLVARIQAHRGQRREAEGWAANLKFDSDAAFAFLGIAQGLIAQGKEIDKD